MQRVLAAALAPADPSSQDRAVAAAARATMTAAERQLGQTQKADPIAKAYGPPRPDSGQQINATA